ncbi:MAG: hypothetical protein QHC79_09700 [Pseudosphingobacterium sp.]|nr:hypothetical protein [Pseudosphingobacterium sp.]
MQAVIDSQLTVGDLGPNTSLPIIRTYTGKFINVQSPKLDDIVIDDIAHGLSHTCRFGGHTIEFYSVAQHCVEMADFVIRTYPDDKVLQLAALLHDASEAYLGDMPSPIKAILPDYKRLENILMRAIAFKFGFSFPLDTTIKQVDEMALSHEWHNKVLKNDLNYRSWSSYEASTNFIEKYNQITNA